MAWTVSRVPPPSAQTTIGRGIWRKGAEKNGINVNDSAPTVANMTGPKWPNPKERAQSCCITSVAAKAIEARKAKPTLTSRRSRLARHSPPSRAKAKVVRNVATQSFQPSSSPPVTRTSRATKITFVPSTGVAMEMSPRLIATKVKTWPMKKAVPAKTAWVMLAAVKGSPPWRSQVWNRTAPMRFTMNRTLQGCPPSMARFRAIAARV